MKINTVASPSDGIRLGGDLYLPEGATGPVSTVATAPGFRGVKEPLMPAYATALNETGIAVLSFDYAGVGESEGEPRQRMDLDAQQRG
ncbi:hypothetical protein CFN78_00075 [Amycolatopsis antarctica]|uniref:Alpha/beta hydrolase n=1 Tax=Amycolatopsis antarctica TaxID=1854586 RepID=A0A263DB20_9PSEU|nr:hypothetical protein [Amycolatopsis antarctica]OZM74686.1 hypothetical protein CFN78_00075 [Amycolatopsis antarctica]